MIPGFFGFGRLGDIRYFHHVEDILEQALEARGLSAEIHAVPTLPTGSIPSRVETLLETVEAEAPDDRPIHLVGHSTGGLDARIVTTPGVSVADPERRARLRERIESVVTVATPHFGTPLASVFDGFFGQKLLFIFSLATIYTLRFGRLPTSILFELVGVVARLDDNIGLRHTILDQVYENLLSNFDVERRDEIQTFLGHVRSDRSALGQLTPGSIELLNAAAGDARDVDYGSVVTCAARPTLRGIGHIGWNPYRLASHGLFRLLHRLSGLGVRVRQLTSYADRLFEDLGRVPNRRDSDGVVPTQSQPWGELICAVRGDHLDVCGHFSAPDHEPPHYDWMASGSEFDRADFERVWHGIADFLADA